MSCILYGLLAEAQFAIEARALLSRADDLISNLCGMFVGCFLSATETHVACSFLILMRGCASHLACLTVSTSMRVCNRMFHKASSHHAFSARQSHAVICQQETIEGKTWKRPANHTKTLPTNLLKDSFPHSACVGSMSRIYVKLALVLDAFSKTL